MSRVDDTVASLGPREKAELRAYARALGHRTLQEAARGVLRDAIDFWDPSWPRRLVLGWAVVRDRMFLVERNGCCGVVWRRYRAPDELAGRLAA